MNISGCSEAYVKAATVRERAVTGGPNIKMNGPSTRLLARAALMAPAGGSTHCIHEQSPSNRQDRKGRNEDQTPKNQGLEYAYSRRGRALRDREENCPAQARRSPELLPGPAGLLRQAAIPPRSPRQCIQGRTPAERSTVRTR
jgi:hypothetical protein